MTYGVLLKISWRADSEVGRRTWLDIVARRAGLLMFVVWLEERLSGLCSGQDALARDRLLGLRCIYTRCLM
jgi:hypothetical protein